MEFRHDRAVLKYIVRNSGAQEAISARSCRFGVLVAWWVARCFFALISSGFVPVDLLRSTNAGHGVFGYFGAFLPILR